MSNSHTQETYKGLITLAVSALKAALLVNGGAAVAVLAFLGHIWPQNGDQAPAIAAAIDWPFGLFIAGLVAAGLASVFAYPIAAH